MSVNALRRIVIGLGVLIVIALIAVIWGIVDASRRAGNGEDAPVAADSDADTRAATRDLDLDLPPECDIVSAEADGSRLVIVTGGAPTSREACARTFVIDTRRDTVQLTVRP